MDRDEYIGNVQDTIVEEVKNKKEAYMSYVWNTGVRVGSLLLQLLIATHSIGHYVSSKHNMKHFVGDESEWEIIDAKNSVMSRRLQSIESWQGKDQQIGC